MKFTREEFEAMYSGFNPKVQITPTDIAVMDGVEYEIKAVDDGIELTERVGDDSLPINEI